jgi:hypothetical protein
MNNTLQINDNADGIVDAALSRQEETLMNTVSTQPETESLAAQLRAKLSQRLDGDLDDATLHLLDQVDEAERLARTMQEWRASIQASMDANREAQELEGFDDDDEESSEDDEPQAEMSTPVYEVVEIPRLPGLQPERPVCWFVDQVQAEQRAYQLMVAYVWARRFFVRQVDVTRVSSPYAEVSLE